MSNRDWLQGQMDGGYLHHIRETFALLKDSGFTRSCGSSRWESGSSTDTHEAMFEEDERLAEFLGKFALTLCSGRIRRTWYAFDGYPHRMLRILINEREGTAVIAQLKQDYEAYKKVLSDDVPKTKKIKELIARSVFVLPKTIQ